MRGRLSRSVFLVVAACVAGAAAVHAQEAESSWIAATGGTIPQGAIAYGRESDGRQQYACRGSLAGGIHLGKIVSGSAGCNIGFGVRGVTLTAYEVLAKPVTKAAFLAVGALHMAATEAVASGRELRAESMIGMVRRGFDDKGQPYVEKTLPDGTIERTQPTQVTLIHPDGTTEVVHPQIMLSNVPPPTPPELPSDASRGRAWVEDHDQNLNWLIRMLVNSDPAEIKKFEEGERKAVGDDVFAQISYRTRIAQFLAKAK